MKLNSSTTKFHAHFRKIHPDFPIDTIRPYTLISKEALRLVRQLPIGSIPLPTTQPSAIPTGINSTSTQNGPVNNESDGLRALLAQGYSSSTTSTTKK